jgi:CspA family cold shock protein
MKSKENVTNMKGTIKWYNTRKGYGFIVGDDGKEVFVHRTALPAETSLNEGDAVEFEIETSDRGPQAKNVKKA